jgi:hypothetical protein
VKIIGNFTGLFLQRSGIVMPRQTLYSARLIDCTDDYYRTGRLLAAENPLL